MTSQIISLLILLTIIISTFSIDVIAQSPSKGNQQDQYPEEVEKFLKGIYGEQQQDIPFDPIIPGDLQSGWRSPDRCFFNLSG